MVRHDATGYSDDGTEQDGCVAPRAETQTSEEEVLRQTRGAFSGGFVLVSSRMVAWVLALVMTIMLPRYLGVTGFGRLFLAITLAGIMSIIVEFGMNSLVARQVSWKRQDATRYLLNGGVLKAALWILASVLLGAIVRIAGYPLETQLATAILAVSVLIASGSSLLVAVLQANDKMRWIAVSAVAEKVAYAGLGATVLLLGYGVLAVATVTVVSVAIGFLLDAWWFRRLARQTDAHSGWQGLEVKAIFVQALPFFSVLFFGAIYFRVDVVILSLFANDATVGYYGAAYRLFQTTYIVADAVLFALFPLLCRLASQTSAALVVATQKCLDVLLLIGIPISTGMLILSKEIVVTLYGARFEASVLLLQVLSVAVVLMYADGVFVQVLIATQQQKRLAVTAIVAAFFNVGLNLALIPSLGALGAATTTVATEILVIAMNFSFLPSAVRNSMRFRVAGKAAVASTLMAGVLALLSGQSPLLLVPVGFAMYVVGIIALKAVSREDWIMIRSAFTGGRST